MPSCSAVGCKNSSRTKKMMAAFPRDPKRRYEWAVRVNRANWEPSDNSFLCEIHFDSDQWEKTRQDGKRKLKCTAIPTLFDHTKATNERKSEYLKESFSEQTVFPSSEISFTDQCLPLPIIEEQRLVQEEQLIHSLLENVDPLSASVEASAFANKSAAMIPARKSLDPLLEERLEVMKQQNAEYKKQVHAVQRSRRFLYEKNSKQLNAVDSLGKKKRVHEIVCSAKDCSNKMGYSDYDITFHKFPLDDSLMLNKWLSVCKEELTPTKWSVLCSEHFSADSFCEDDKYLISTAVPFVFNEEHCDYQKRTGSLHRMVPNVINGRNEMPTENSNENGLQECERTCRLCAVSGTNHCPIFGETNLAEKISRCLPVIILPSDELPLYLCRQCVHNLNISYKLIITSQKVDAILRSKLAAYKDHSPEEGGENNPTSHRKIKQELASSDKEPPDSATQTKRPREEPVFNIEGPIWCDLCDEFFDDMVIFDVHIEHTHLLPWRCSLCDHSFQTSQELITHKKLNHSGHILTCAECVEPSPSLVGVRVKIEDLHSESLGQTVEQRELKEEEEQDDPPSSMESTEEVAVKQETSGEVSTDLTCTRCSMVFDDPMEFRKHHTMHLPRLIRCKVCQKRCPSIYDYFVHQRKAHDLKKSNSQVKRMKVHTCKYCKKMFRMNQKLVIHLRKHKKEMLEDPTVTVYKCITCPKKFVDRTLYQKHRNVHDPACWHKFRCNICNKSFIDRFKLRLHQLIHDGIQPYKCDVCGTSFNRNANMIRHRAKHFAQTCCQCSKVFQSTRSLTIHLKESHGLMPKPKAQRPRTGEGNSKSDHSICRFCGKQLSSYNSLLNHERIHTGDKPYVCPRCGKAFRSVMARWDHMVRHEKSNFICELCGRTLSNKLNLARHLRKHAAIDQRRFECKDCGRLFHLKRRLDSHLQRSHHTERTS